MKNMDF